MRVGVGMVRQFATAITIFWDVLLFRLTCLNIKLLCFLEMVIQMHTKTVQFVFNCIHGLKYFETLLLIVHLFVVSRINSVRAYVFMCEKSQNVIMFALGIYSPCRGVIPGRHSLPSPNLIQRKASLILLNSWCLPAFTSLTTRQPSWITLL